MENGALDEVPISGLAGVDITARETVDDDANGQIDRIRLTASEAVNDDFTGFTATVSGYMVSGYASGGTDYDDEFFLLLSESGAPDTGATPAVQITSNSSLRDNSTGTRLVFVDQFPVTPVDNAGPVLIAASSNRSLSGGNLLAGTDLTLVFSEDIDANSTPGAMSAADFKVQPDGATPAADLDGATATVALGAANELVVSLTGPTTGGGWSTAAEIDLDVFTSVADNAPTPNQAVENGALDEVPISGLAPVGLPPSISYTLTVAGTDRVYLRFSEPVRVFGGGASFSTTTWSYSGAPTITLVEPLNPAGNYCVELFLHLSTSVPGDDFFVPETVTISTVVEDADGNFLTSPTHVVSDLGINIIVPVWATAGLGAGVRETLHEFAGNGRLELTGDITLSANIQPPGQIGAVTSVFFDVAVPGGFTQGGLWLPPPAVDQLVPAANTQAREQPQDSATNAVRTYTIPSADSEIRTGARVEFLFRVGSLLCVRARDPADPRSVAPWSFDLSGVARQRGDVTILKNVINPQLGEKTEIRYTLSHPGLVTAQVFTLSGEIVSVLARGKQSAGSYKLLWDGRNRGGRIVARGLYFVRVTGPDMDEFRKILVVK